MLSLSKPKFVMEPEKDKKPTQSTGAETGAEEKGKSLSPPPLNIGAGGDCPPGQNDGGSGSQTTSASHDNGCGCGNCVMEPAPAPVAQQRADQGGSGANTNNTTGGVTATAGADPVTPTYIGKEFTVNRNANVLSQGADKDGIATYAAEKSEIGKKYPVGTGKLPKGASVKVITTDQSQDAKGPKEVAQVEVLSVPTGGDTKMVGQQYWTTRTNINTSGDTVTSTDASIRTSGEAIMGIKSIPANTKIKVLDTKGITEFPEAIRLENSAARNAYFSDRYMRLYLLASWKDAKGVEQSGWISANDVAGGFANEVLGTSKVPAASMIDSAPNHKTVGTATAPLLTPSGKSYDYKYQGKDKVLIKQGTYVRIQTKSADGKYAQVVSEDQSVNEWTALSNLNMAKKKTVGEGTAAVDFFEVSAKDAYARVEVEGYKESGVVLKRGDFVETYGGANGKLLVAKVTKQGDKYVPDTTKSYIDGAQLADGWSTDLYGTNAAWGVVEIGGARTTMYRGQRDFVNLGGSGGKMKQVSVEAYPNLIKMITAAQSNVKADKSADPIGIEINSCFRTYFSQKYFKDNENKPGFNTAAAPGSSDHQDSNAFDLNNLSDAKVYTWLKNNAWRYDIVQNVNKSNERHHWAYLPGQGKEGYYTTWGTKSTESW
jgi:hypothetical protein